MTIFKNGKQNKNYLPLRIDKWVKFEFPEGYQLQQLSEKGQSQWPKKDYNNTSLTKV